jgi:formylglycine-generating enzyme required for sulfatase activity
MVVVPAGSFTMGSPDAERRWYVEMGAKEEWASWETPQHRVTIARPFAVGSHEVTRGQYAAFVKDTNRGAGDGCFIWTGTEWKEEASRGWRDPGFPQDDRHPVACVSWDDAKAYVEWLGRKTGKGYRLLSESEWEYAARAGTTAARYWGDDRENAEGCGYANTSDQTRAGAHNLTRQKTDIFMCEDGHVHTAPAGSFKANPFGLHDMLGNVWEWVEDCWHGSYAGAPSDGSAWTAGGNCGQRVLRGGSWINVPRILRAASRVWIGTGYRNFDAGFRVARTN